MDIIKQGSTPEIKSTLKVDGIPLDLTDYTVVFNWRKKTKTTNQNPTPIASIKDPDQVANTGVVRTYLTDTETSEAEFGDYYYEYKATHDITGDILYFPLQNNTCSNVQYAELRVAPSLG